MQRRTRLVLALLAGAGLIAGGVAAIVGKGRAGPGDAMVRVADGDTFTLDGRRIRLFGIDAPELAQSCTSADGRPYACGRAAAEALTRLLGRARPDCVERDQDPYGRSVAVCTAGGRELNRAMVRQGWAVAFTRYSRDYLGDEAAARQARRGLWQGRFARPDQYRAERRPR